jgi:3-phenylpropionate/trans-cinnamate dioxygenase ferredoxin reductase component
MTEVGTGCRAPDTSVLIVGGGLAAARTSEELRKQGHRGPITMLSAESSLPYDRPPLSKAALLSGYHAAPFRIDYDALEVAVHLGHRVASVDLVERVATGTFGAAAFDRLVIATGASPVRVPGPGEQSVLRTVADATRLSERLVPGARVVIIGASWIGAEVATAARSKGAAVAVVEAGPAPLTQALGKQIGSLTLPWWDGIELRLDSKVACVEADEVVLTDGERIPADTIVTGIGVHPEIDWLRGTGLELGRGVHTDHALRTNIDGVVAVGDVACWLSKRFATRMNTEHWDDASKGAAVAAASVIDGTQSRVVHDPVPYFWSDQFGHKMQYVGHHDASSEFVVRPRNGDSGWTVCWYDTDLRLSAVLSVDRMKESIKARRIIADQLTVDVDRLYDANLELTGCVA